MAAPFSQLAVKPHDADHEHVAALPLAGLTAYASLVGGARPQQGQHVTVDGAAGGVEHLAVQIATALGATVTAVASDDSAAWLRQLGATHVVNHRHEAFWKDLPPADAVLDLVGSPDTETHLLDTVVDGGAYICIPRDVRAAVAHAADVRQIRTRGFFVSPSGNTTRLLAELMDKGHLDAKPAPVFPLREAAKAQARGEEGHNRGTLVLQVET